MRIAAIISAITAILYGAVCNTAEAATVPDSTGRAAKEVSYLDAISFRNKEVIKDAREVCLNMDIVLDSARIKTQHTVSLTPVLVSADGSREMPFQTIIVDGKTRHKVFLRRERLDGPDGQRDSALAIIQRKNGQDQEYAYVSTIPYSSWMLDGKIEIQECVKGCADCGEGESESTLADQVLPRFIPEWRTGRIEPAPEPVKRREESREARLHFRWDKYDILPEWKDNRTVLDTVTNSISLVKDKDYISISGIYVAGYASPEGTWDYNIRLSSRRAKSFADYIRKHNNVEDSLMHIDWSGEDWAGFRTALEQSTFPKKDRIIKVIDTYTSDRNQCERQMMKLISRKEYIWLLRNIYPGLRHCTYRVEYEVRNFDLEEARQTIRTRPQDLSLSEMYKVAGSYPADSEEYEYAMSMAARYYPDSPSVLADMAADALDRGDAAAAVELLEEHVTEWAGESGEISADLAELMNILGTAYAQNGQYDRAEEILESAAETGNANATHNMTQLLNVIDQL